MIEDILNDIAGNFLRCLEMLCVVMDSKKKVKSVTAAPLRYDNINSKMYHWTKQFKSFHWCCHHYVIYEQFIVLHYTNMVSILIIFLERFYF